MEENHNNSFEYLKKLTLLYAEDEEETRNILAAILKDYVGNLILAKDGEEALELFMNHQVDLILTDILMPRMDGIELTRQIRAYTTNPSVPVILATAFTDTRYLLDSIKLKCNGYILKPVDLEELFNLFHSVMLPHLQMQEIRVKNQLLEALGVIIGGKKVEIIKYLIEHCNHEKIFHGSHDDIANSLNVSRQTVIKVFQQLIDFGLLERVKNKVYRINEKNVVTMNENLN